MKEVLQIAHSADIERSVLSVLAHTHSSRVHTRRVLLLGAYAHYQCSLQFFQGTHVGCMSQFRLGLSIRLGLCCCPTKNCVSV